MPTSIQHPLAPEVSILVRPDPDWTQRMTDACNSVLVNSRRTSAGTIPIRQGRLLISDVMWLDRCITVDVVPGEYELTLTIAYLGAKKSGDYEEHVSHAFALLRDHDTIAIIEPMTADDGTEIFLDAASVVFGAPDVVERVAGEQVGGLLLLPTAEVGADGKSKRAVPADGDGALITFSGGTGRGTYPLFRIEDASGQTVGVLVDCYVDNRPYDP